jgi:hypothetical protein
MKLAGLNGVECWSIKRQRIQQISVTKIQMLWWICGNTRNNQAQNDIYVIG